MNYIRELFIGPDGDISSKRVVMFWLLIILTIYIFTAKIVEFQVIGSLLGAITAIAGVQAISHT